MLVLNNYNCQYIELVSPKLAEVITDFANIESVFIVGTKSCCEPAIQSEIDLTQQSWSLNFPTLNSLTINTIKVKNILTNEIFEIINGNYLVGDYSCATGDITNLFTLVNTWFTTNTSTTVSQSYNYDVDTNTCVYTITDLPVNYIMIEMTISGACSDLAIPFTYDALETVFIDDNKIYILPAFFGSNTIADGVYKFVINVTYENGDLLQLASCFFYDCKTKCEVSKQIQELPKIGSDDMSVFLMHYTLVQSSNCNCNCDELCVIWKELNERLCKGLNCQDCGCN